MTEQINNNNNKSVAYICQQTTNTNLLYSTKELYSILCGDLNGKEIQERGDISILRADSFSYTVNSNTTL